MLLFVLLTKLSFADEIKIKPAADYQGYSHQELQKRVWELEKAVEVLQQQMNSTKGAPVAMDAPKPVVEGAKWFCKIFSRAEVHAGVAFDKGSASKLALDKCKAANNGDGLFCKNMECNQ
jgi:hypothetical protein